MLDSNDLCLLTLASDQKIASTSLLWHPAKISPKILFADHLLGLGTRAKMLGSPQAAQVCYGNCETM